MAANAPLAYRVLVSGLLPATGPALPDGTRPRWSPLSHTLIYGPTEAAVVDPPITVAQATALANWIESFGRRLSFIYITHWHADHWLTTSELARRFPGVTVYASEATIGRMTASTPDGVPAGLSERAVSRAAPGYAHPDPGPAGPCHRLHRRRQELLAVEAGHSDTDDTTVLHAPSIGLVAAGDVVYNDVHQYLAETPDGGMEGWHRALERRGVAPPRRRGGRAQGPLPRRLPGQPRPDPPLPRRGRRAARRPAGPRRVL